MARPTTRPALAHVALTVSDLDASARWDTTVRGSEPVLDEDTGPCRHVVYAVGGTLLIVLAMR